MPEDSRRSHHPVDRFVGERIARRRTALGVSQMLLAERIGVSFQQVQKYEGGKNRVSASRLYQVAAALGTSVADFFPPPAADGPPDASGTEPPAGDLSLIPEPELRRAVALIIDRLARAA